MIPASELILHPDGSVYHLALRPEHLGRTVITVGDPARVPLVSRHFSKVEFTRERREFVTHTGKWKGRRVTVISTGIGTDNVDIVLNELDALVNIDLTTRQPKAEHTALDLIRIGTSGILSEKLPLGSLLISSHAVGLDGLLHYYERTPTAEEQRMTDTLTAELGDRLPLAPYVSTADADLLRAMGQGMQEGVTLTAPGFYAPQGRELRAKTRFGPKTLRALADIELAGRRITNFEMETAGIYGLAALLGHRAVSCNALLANRMVGTFSTKPEKIVARLIERVLENIRQLP